jgi:hypothetical protein
MGQIGIGVNTVEKKPPMPSSGTSLPRVVQRERLGIKEDSAQ